MNAALRFAGTSALKDLRRLRRDPSGLAMCIAMPLVITLLVSVIFGGNNPSPQGKLLVVDEDDSLLSSLVRGAFGSGPLAKMVVVESVVADEGRARIDRGDASGLLFIPKGFEKAVLRDEPCELRLLTNPAQRILPGIIKESLFLLAEAEFYAQALLGDQIRKFADRPPTEAEVAEVSVAVRRLVEKFQRFLDPPVIKLETITLTEKKQPSIGVLFFPGMLFFGVILVGQTLGSDVWKEKSAGTLRRTLVTPGQLWAFLVGKLVSVAAVLAAVSMLGLICHRWLLSQHIAAPILALLWVILSGAVIYLVLVVLNLIATGARGANVLTSLVVFVFAMVGGGMFPFEMMPDWLAAVGRWTPNGWASVEFKNILVGTFEPLRLATAGGGLAIVGIAAFVLALWRLRRFPLT